MLDKFGLPLTGGNSFVSKQAFDAREDINETFKVSESCESRLSFDVARNIPSSVEGYTLQISKPIYNDWFLLCQEAQYYGNLFDVDTEDNEIKKMWKMLTWTLFFYGNAAVEKLGDKYLVYCLTGEIKRDGTGYPIEAGGLLSFLALSDKVTSEDLKNKEIEGTKILKGDNVVFFKYNMLEYSCWITLHPFLKELQQLMIICKTSSRLLAKKLKFTENNEEGSLDELDAIFTPWLPYLKVKGVNPTKSNSAIMNNTIEEIKIGSGNTKDITDYVDWFQNYWYSKLGRRTNVNEKQERNINSEVMTSQNNFDVLENELRDWLEIGLNHMKEKWGVEAELTFIQTTKESDDEVEESNTGGVDNGI